MTQHQHIRPEPQLGARSQTNKTREESWLKNHPMFAELAVDGNGNVKKVRSKAYDPERKR